MQPETALQVSVVHASESLQTSGVPGVQVPLWHVSAPLQTVASAHAVPFATTGFWQPVDGLHESVVHGLLSPQASGVPAVQTPPWHVSAPLQTVASAHDVPFTSGEKVHPKVGLQASGVHWLPALQTRADPGVPRPDWHVSAPLHVLPSLQDVPFKTAAA